jgi:CHRD domain-containing protein
MRGHRLIVITGATVVALALVGFGAGAATKDRLTATMNTGQEVPKPKATRGTGKFTGTLSGRKLSWKLTFSKLTGPAVAAHIHLAPRGKANPAPAVGLCGPCTSGQTGSATISAKVDRALERGTAYVNVHTKKNSGGEIRGQIKYIEG